MKPNPNPLHPHKCLDCGNESWSTGINAQEARQVEGGILCKRCFNLCIKDFHGELVSQERIERIRKNGPKHVSECKSGTEAVEEIEIYNQIRLARK